jgi:hypothetical protein
MNATAETTGYFTKRGRLPGLVLLLIGLLTACSGHLAETSNSRDPKARLARAEAIFQERCKTAGEKIYRTVEDVEGVFLMKIRPSGVNYGDQFALTDPYGDDSTGDTYIKTFLIGYHAKSSPPVRGAPPRRGYKYVEAIDPADGKRYRYTGSVREVEERLSGLSGGGTVRITKFALDKTPAQGSQPRYGVTYEDISTREEREYWVAGSSLKVIDLKTNEVMAERIGYMMDRGQGNTSGGRSPWFWAADHACPTFQRNPFYPIPSGHGASAQSNQTEDFVEKILKPVQEK